VVVRPHVGLGLISTIMVLVTGDRMGQSEKRGGSSVGKGGESDVKSQHLQSYSPRLSRLKTDGLVSVSKY
jgi:hypothetical protein